MDRQRSRNAGLLIAGQSLSIIGDSITLIALPQLVLDQTGSVLHVGMVMMLTDIPSFLAVFAGYLRNYFAAKPLIIFYDFIRFVLMLLLAVLVLLKAHLFAVYGLLFVVFLISTLFRPTRIEFMTQLVSKDKLKSLNSLDQTVEAASMALGAALGGYAYALLPLHNLFIIDGLTFLGSAIFALFIRTAGTTEEHIDEVKNKNGNLKTVLSALRTNRLVAYLVIGEAIAGGVAGVFAVMWVVYIRMYLAEDSITLGHVGTVRTISATAVGMILATGWVKWSDQKLSICGYLGMALSLAMLGFTGSTTMTFVAMAILGGFNMVYFVANRTLLQNCAEQKDLIHLLSIETTLSRCGFTIGTLMAGSLKDYLNVGADYQMLLMAACCFVLAGWGLWATAGSNPPPNVNQEGVLA